MHRGIVDHVVYVDAGNAEELSGMEFVFLCVDKAMPGGFMTDGQRINISACTTYRRRHRNQRQWNPRKQKKDYGGR